jgi:hypothetical protein
MQVITEKQSRMGCDKTGSSFGCSVTKNPKRVQLCTAGIKLITAKDE